MGYIGTCRVPEGASHLAEEKESWLEAGVGLLQAGDRAKGSHLNLTAGVGVWAWPVGIAEKKDDTTPST